jgi:hypothetical protein
MKLSLLALLGFLLVNVSPLFAATDSTTPKVKKIPFHGKIQAVDTGAQTITIAGKNPRVFHLTPTTKITDGSGAASTLSAATVGEDSGGSYDKASMTLYSLRIGAKTGSKAAATASTPVPAAMPSPAAPTPATTEPTPAAAPAATTSAATTTTTSTKVKKQTFSGKVVSVDAASSTLVVHGKADQTFTVTTTTKITGVDGLASVTAGSKVSGSYSKSADGATLTVYSLKVTPAK